MSRLRASQPLFSRGATGSTSCKRSRKTGSPFFFNFFPSLGKMYVSLADNSLTLYKSKQYRESERFLQCQSFFTLAMGPSHWRWLKFFVSNLSPAPDISTLFTDLYFYKTFCRFVYWYLVLVFISLIVKESNPFLYDLLPWIACL